MLHFFLQTGTDYFVSGDFGKFLFRVDLSYSGLIHFFFLAFIHLSSRPPLWPFPRIEFLSLFAARCFIDLSVIFYPATHPCFIDLSLIWIWNWCRVEWHSFYGPRKQSQELENFWEKGRAHETESPTWPCKSAGVRFKWLSAPSRLWIFPPLQKNLPREFSILRTDQIIAISGVSVPASYICGIPLIKR